MTGGERLLCLLRHGKAEPTDLPKPDFDRELTERGREASRLVGRYLRDTGRIPNRVLCSPAARTRSTLDGVADVVGPLPDVRFVDALYNADLETYLDEIRFGGEAATTLLVVGHNPATEEAALTLSRQRGNDVERPDRFPTAAMAVIGFDIAEWTDIRQASGTLRAFIRPSDLQED